MDERIVLHVDMNAFFASVEQQCHPQLRGKPIVVCGNPASRTVVAACSYEAKAFGITNGMSVHEARRLCPHVVLVGGNAAKYVDVAQHLFAMMAEYTPLMEVFSIDEAFLDVTRTYALAAASPEDLARLLKRRIRAAYGLTCSIGIAPNKLLAKLAANLRKPDGLVRLRPADVPPLMERLPVEKLCGVGPRLAPALNDLGIITCADLGRADADLLRAKFGVIGLHLKRMGQGLDDAPVAASSAQDAVKSMGHCYTLPRDTPDPAEIAGTLLRLCEQVARRLRADGYQGRTIGLTIRYADFSGVSHELTVPHPTDHGLQIFRTAQRLFARHCEPLRQRVRLVGVGVSGLSRHERQPSFLPEDVRLDRLDRCLDRINDRFGECTVTRAAALKPLVAKSHGFLVKHTTRRGLLVR